MIPLHHFMRTWMIPWIGLTFALAMFAGELRPAYAQAAHDRSELGEVEEGLGGEVADVVVDGHRLFRVRGVSSYPAKKRAHLVAKRIREISRNQDLSIESLHVEEKEDRSIILVGDHLVIQVFDADALIEGISRKILVETMRIKIIDAVTAYRADRAPKALLVSTGYAAVATLAFIFLLFFIQFVFRHLQETFERQTKRILQKMQTKSYHLLRAETVWRTLSSLMRTIQASLWVAVCFLYMDLVLSLFPWTRTFGRRLFTMVLDPLAEMGRSFLGTIPNLVFLTLLVLIVRYILKMIRLFFTRIENGSIHFANFDREWAWPTYRIIRLFIMMFALVIAYPNIPGSASPAFKGVSIFLGVIFSLGSSSVLSNMIAGYTLTYRRAFKVGDRIRIDEIMGDVTEMRLLVTHLRTIKNEDVVVPNSTILTSHVVNYSRYAKDEGLILHTTVGIGYETPWRQVEAMLLLAADRTEGLLKKPKPFVRQKVLGDFAVTYEINVYCSDPQEMASLYTDLHRNILDAFNEHGVQIMTPAYEGDPEKPKVVAKEKWYSAPAKTS